MVHDNHNFPKYVELCGNTYAATLFVGKYARKLAEKYSNVISHAEALAWILSGVVPEGVKNYSERIKQRSQRSLMYAKESLVGVLDENVKNSVLESLRRSKKEGHLLYVYEEVYDKDLQARVRVLTNKIWYESQDLDV